MAARDMIGRVLSSGSATVTADSIAAFARALGDEDPLYLDPAAARRGPFGAIVAPPTYPIAFMVQAMAGGMGTFLELGLDFMTLVHGEQEFEYRRPICAGETLTLTGRIADVYEKTGASGTLDFVILETEARDAAGAPVFFSRNTLISRRT
jgi:acyl dehydratase